MSLYSKIRRILPTMLPAFNQQTTKISTCKANVLNKTNLLDINGMVRKSPITRFYGRIEADTETKDIHPKEKLYKRSFRKAVKQHQADTFKLNGFIESISCIGTYNKTTPYPFVTNWRWYVTTKDQGGPVKQSGGGLGKLDSKGEAGFFHKVNLSRLEQIKKMLREKRLMQQKDAAKDDSDAKK